MILHFITTFFTSFFTGIGIGFALIYAVRCGLKLSDKFRAASKRKRELNDSIIATLNRIDERLQQLKP